MQGTLPRRLDYISESQLTPEVFWRFIDDIFGVWVHGEKALLDFVAQLNSIHTTIKFTLNYSYTTVEFLDVKVTRNQDGSVTTDLHKKSTDTSHYLENTSMHPPHCKRSIPRSQAIRIQRICSDDRTCEIRKNELKQNLKLCGYRNVDTKENVPKSAPSSSPKERIPFTIEYNVHLPNMSKLIAELWPITQISPTFKDMPPPLICYKRARNLQDILVRAEVNQKVVSKPQQRTITDFFSQSNNRTITATKVSKCGKNCINCKYMNAGTDTFKSEITGKTYPIKSRMNCETKNLVYLITCRKCAKQYCGECSTTLKIRFANHRASITNKYDLPVAKHFNRLGHVMEDMIITPIEKISDTANTNAKRKEREAFWIYELHTLSPKGINKKDSIF